MDKKRKKKERGKKRENQVHHVRQGVRFEIWSSERSQGSLSALLRMRGEGEGEKEDEEEEKEEE